LPEYDGWEPLRDDSSPQREKALGSGGQGTVYLARSPKRVQEIQERAQAVKRLLRDATAQVQHKEVNFSELSQKIVALGGDDPVSDLGALKHFKIPSHDIDEEKKAIGRLESEVQALNALREHPAILNLLHANTQGRFIVTEYHQRGTLDRQLNLYKGDAVAALQAFKPLADVVWRIHQQGIIHRDIKPENIFVAASGNLVLGDFGIVFFQEGSERLTTTYERVGSHEWMAPWAYRKEKLELSKISPALDIFPLAKVLWSMIAGQNGFPFWEYDRDENNLENLFPDDPAMPLVNSILAKCIVREEGQCDSSAQSHQAAAARAS
jgi:serine/threonine protein kinase